MLLGLAYEDLPYELFNKAKIKTEMKQLWKVHIANMKLQFEWWKAEKGIIKLEASLERYLAQW